MRLVWALSSLIHLSSSYPQKSCEANSEAGTLLFRSLTNESHYDKGAMPSCDDEPLIIRTRAYIYHIKVKETRKLDIKLQILLELSWKDRRLEFNETAAGVSMVMGGLHHLEEVWIPHVIFANEKDSHTMGTRRKDDIVMIMPDGSVLFTTRLSEMKVKHFCISLALSQLFFVLAYTKRLSTDCKVKLTHKKLTDSVIDDTPRLQASMFCRIHLGTFPFDQQKCHLTMDSWRYNASELELVWDDETPLQVGHFAKSIVEFEIISFGSQSSVEDFSDPNYDGEKMSSLVINMRLERCYGFYLMNYYLPSALIVILSWVSFWLDPSALPARVMLGSSTMLTFMQLGWSASGVPKVSHFVANDIWAVTCTAFIFLALSEFAFVNTIDRRSQEKVRLKKLSSKYILRGGVDTAAGRMRLRRTSSLPSSPEIRRHFARNQQKEKTIKDLKEVSISLVNLGLDGKRLKNESTKEEHHMTPQEIALWIDCKSRIIVPLSFLVFNVFYWLPLVIVKG